MLRTKKKYTTVLASNGRRSGQDPFNSDPLTSLRSCTLFYSPCFMVLLVLEDVSRALWEATKFYGGAHDNHSNNLGPTWLKMSWWWPHVTKLDWLSLHCKWQKCPCLVVCCLLSVIAFASAMECCFWFSGFFYFLFFIFHFLILWRFLQTIISIFRSSIQWLFLLILQIIVFC